MSREPEPRGQRQPPDPQPFTYGPATPLPPRVSEPRALIPKQANAADVLIVGARVTEASRDLVRDVCEMYAQKAIITALETAAKYLEDARTYDWTGRARRVYNWSTAAKELRRMAQAYERKKEES